MKKYFQKLLEFSFMFLVSMYFIITAVCWLYSVWPVLAFIGALAVITLVIYRIWKNGRGSGEW